MASQSSKKVEEPSEKKSAVEIFVNERPPLRSYTEEELKNHPWYVSSSLMLVEEDVFTAVDIQVKHEFYNQFLGYQKIDQKLLDLYGIMKKVRIENDMVDEVLDTYVKEAILSSIPKDKLLDFAFLPSSFSNQDSSIKMVSMNYEIIPQGGRDMRKLLTGAPFQVLNGFIFTVVHSEDHFYGELLIDIFSANVNRKLNMIFFDSLGNHISRGKKMQMAVLRAKRILESNGVKVDPDFYKMRVDFKTFDHLVQEGRQCGYYSILFAKIVTEAVKTSAISPGMDLEKLFRGLKAVQKKMVDKDTCDAYIKNLAKEIAAHGATNFFTVQNMRAKERASLSPARNLERPSKPTIQSPRHRSPEQNQTLKVQKPSWVCPLFEKEDVVEVPLAPIRRMKRILKTIGYGQKELGYRNLYSDNFIKSTKLTLEKGITPEVIKLSGTNILGCGFEECSYETAYSATLHRHMNGMHSPIVNVYFNLMRSHLPILTNDASIYDKEDKKFVSIIHVKDIDFPYICSPSSKLRTFKTLILAAIGEGRSIFYNWLKENFENCGSELKQEIIRNREMWMTAKKCDYFKTWHSAIQSESLKDKSSDIEKAMQLEFPCKVSKKDIKNALSNDDPAKKK